MLNEKTEKSYSDALGRMGHSSLTKAKIEGYEAWYGRHLPEDKNATIYDFGCGHGDFLEYLSLKGYKNISGGDINSECVRISSERVRIPVDKIGDMKNFSQINQDEFDCVNLKDVVEHIEKESLVEFLADIRATLKADGFIIVSCPQICGFTSMFTLYDDFTHKTLFTENSLRYVLNAAGYTRIKIISPQRPLTLNPLKIISRTARFVWFKIVRLIYYLERPGERMPSIQGDRLNFKAWRN